MGNFRKTLLLNLKHLSTGRFVNGWIIFLLDLFLCVSITLLVTFGTFLYLDIDFTNRQFWLMALASRIASFIAILIFKLYANVIRHATLREGWRIITVAFIKILLIAALCDIFRIDIPDKMLWITRMGDLFVTIAALLSMRILILILYHFLILSTYKKRKYIWIYGTGENSIAIAGGRTADIFMMDYRIRGFITMDEGRKDYRICNLPVYFIEDQDDLARMAGIYDIDGILFPNSKAAQREKNRLIRYCESLNLKTLIVPDMEEVKDGQIHRSIRPIKIEDLLGRDEIKINMREIGKLLEGKVILVTGAAGSIGSEICRQLAKFPIQQLICFDMGETPMHSLRLELEEKFPTFRFVPVIGNVRNQERVNFAFRAYHPQVVFHAAAYKHVPLMEENLCEAIRVNIFRTRVVADHAVKYGVEKFVMVSTDKAVNPTNIMGCSKRIAEICVQTLSLAIMRGEIAGKTRFITTRFGNVLGSNGSVIPRFREQIKNGGPVTVTHPDIIRYFMTIPEACRLVLEAGTLGNGGEIFIFEMGEPVKIVDLARRMIKLSGLKPDRDIQIKFTGLRSGEKLYEELLSTKENTQATPHEKIRVARVREYDYREVVTRIDLLTRLACEVKIPEMVQEMKEFVPEFKSQNSEF
ncbi:MAG: polysaccharide biosynthesis protein [Bacteroides sp.]|nr:polysaccharide biosynthesis protein [Bacteroides sp.]